MQKKLDQIKRKEQKSLDLIKEKAEKARKDATASLTPAAVEPAAVDSPLVSDDESDDAPVNRG